MDLARHGRALRLALPIGAALVLFAIAWPTAHVELGLGAAAAMVAGLVAAAPVATAGVAPVGGWALSALGAVVTAGLAGQGATSLAVPVVHLVALLGLMLVVVVRARRWVAGGAVLATTLLAHQLLAPGDLDVSTGVVMVAVVALLVRQVMTSRRALADERATGEHERELRVVAEERARIARDLHDVVAHSMSLVVVRAQSARYRVPGTSDAMADELTAIADAARGALGELRGVLGVLRSAGDGADGTDVPARPQPGPADVAELLEATRDAGVELTVTQVGDLADAGPAVVVSVHRILSEALANATRHAGGAPVAVHLEHDDAALRLRVTNGPGRDLAGPGSGMGLTVMRERAAAVGGRLDAGPASPDGFVVDAVLPVTAAVEVPA